MSHRENITRIKAVYNALEELAEEVVFIGGATVSLYNDRPATEVRPTDDVDIVVELAHYTGYTAIEGKLREKGFINDVASGVICRYTIQGITVDIMPTSDEILGFSNKWYQEAFRQSEDVTIDEDYTIRIFSAPYFIATKLEAFKDRGEGDGRFSSDFEDIIHVLNNRSTIWQEMNDSKEALKLYLKEEFSNLYEQAYIDEWISGHLEHSEQSRVRYVLGAIREFVQS